MQDLLASIGIALEGTPAIALAAAFVWGILSLLLSPCHLASIPLIVGFIDAQRVRTTRRALALSLLFAVGILITIALLGTVTALAGRMLGDIGAWGNYLVAAIFFVVGLHLLGVLPLTFSAARAGLNHRGLLAAFVLGLVFGIALGPCTFAYLAPLIAVTFKMSTEQFAYGALLLSAYGAGHCSVIVLAGTSTGLVERALHWNRDARSARLLRGTCGILVILGGLWLLYTAP
jgi:cytochrome c-type biogenesis protein